MEMALLITRPGRTNWKVTFDLKTHQMYQHLEDRNEDLRVDRGSLIADVDYRYVTDMIIEEITVKWNQEQDGNSDSEMFLQDILAVINHHIPSFAFQDVDFIRRVTELMTEYTEQRTVCSCLAILHQAFFSEEILSLFCNDELISFVYDFMPHCKTAVKIIGQFASINESVFRMLVESGDRDIVVTALDMCDALRVTDPETIECIMECPPDIIAEMFTVIYHSEFVEENLPYFHEMGVFNILLDLASDAPFGKQRSILTAFLHFTECFPSKILQELAEQGLLRIMCKHLDEGDEINSQILEALNLFCCEEDMSLVQMTYEELCERYEELAWIDGFLNYFHLIQSIIDEYNELG